jgi:hypothetical protein
VKSRATPTKVGPQVTTRDAMSSQQATPLVRCKPRHEALSKNDPPHVRTVDVRSRCPGWASTAVQHALITESLIDPDGGTDSFGRPRKRWSAVAGVVFIGVSSNESQPAYNCYPSEPLTGLVDKLEARAERTLDQLLHGEDTSVAT